MDYQQIPNQQDQNEETQNTVADQQNHGNQDEELPDDGAGQQVNDSHNTLPTSQGGGSYNSQYHLVEPKPPSHPHLFPKRNIHWKAPSIMLSSLIAGFAFLLDHHFFFQSLHHEPTASVTFGQDVNAGIGTAFAFVVRMFFVIAVGAAYWQIFWRQVKAKPIQVEKLDTLSSIQENAWEFLSVKTWARFPVLALLAAIIWLIPIAVVFPPSALTVELSPIPLTTNATRQIAVPDFNRNNFAQFSHEANNGASWGVFSGPQYGIQRVASAVASSGQMLNLPSTSPNSSYQLSFLGPALQCSTIEGSMRNQLLKNVSRSLNCTLEARWRKDDNACYYQSLYLAWAPTSKGVVDFLATTWKNGVRWYSPTIGQAGISGDDVRDAGLAPASIFIATQSELDNSKPWNFVNCSLFNATYNINVNFTGGAQRVDVQKNFTHFVGYYPMLSTDGGAPLGAESNTSNPITGNPAYIETTLEQFGYQSVMDAFGRILAGQVVVSMRLVTGYFNFSTLSTTVMTSSLADSIELSPVKQMGEICSGGLVTCSLEANNHTINIVDPPLGALPLTRAAEQLFENITISLFSNKAYLTTPENSPKVRVTSHSPQNRYVYTSWQLLVPYLVSFLLALLSTVLGGLAMLTNGISYNQKFSTVMRTTRNAELKTAGTNYEVTLTTTDTTGAEPLPENVANAELDFRAQHSTVSLTQIDIKSVGVTARKGFHSGSSVV